MPNKAYHSRFVLPAPLTTFLTTFLVIFLVVFSLLTASAFASNTMRFERISTAQGLSQTTVNTMLQDREGFLWLGTQDGLNRYDGYQFKIYKHHHNDPHSMTSNWINVLFESSEGQLWIGSDDGLMRLDRKSDRFIRYSHDPNNPNTLGNNVVMSITQDQQGDLWIGTYLGGLSRLNQQTGHFTRYHHNPDQAQSLATDKVLTVMVDSTNTIWVGTDGGGLNRFNRQSDNFEHFKHHPKKADSLKNNRVGVVFEDRQSNFWIGTRGGGLSRFNRQDHTFVHYPQHRKYRGQGFIGRSVTAILQDKDDRLWIGGAYNGLSKFDSKTGQFDYIQHDPVDIFSLGSDEIRSIYQDRTGIIWFGTNAAGVSKYNPATAQFVHYKPQPNQTNGLKRGNIWSLYQEGNGIVWIGSDGGGLTRIDRKTNAFVHYLHQPNNPASLSNNDVLSILQDHAGVLWLGTNGGGLSRFNRQNQTFTHWRHNPADPDSISSNRRLKVIIEDRDHYLWIGTDNGLSRFDPDRKTFRRFVHNDKDPSSIGSDYIESLFEDSKGNIWVGTYNNGLDRFNKTTGSFDHYRHDSNNPNSLSNNGVSSIYEDDEGILWLATKSGLNKFDPQLKTFVHYRQQQGLSNDSVMAVVGDTAGYLWLTTNDGLNRFDPRSETVNVYKFSDGIQDNEFSAGASFVDPSGEILVGGINGFNAFYPQDIEDDLTEPAVVLTDFLLNNQPVSLQSTGQSTGSISPLSFDINHTEAIVLSPTDSVFTFEFAALHFASPKQNRYAYRLQGFDKDWVKTNALNRRATYTNMDAGEYVFRIKGSNSDNIWSRQHRTINITILPSPWHTWWAYLLYAALIGAIVLVVVYFRLKELAAERQAATVITTSELQLSLALWGSGDQLWDWDKNVGLIQRKNILSHFSFLSQQTLTGGLDELGVIIHSDDRQVFYQALAAHCRGEQDHFECTYRLKDKEGQWRWVLDRGKIVEFDARGEVTRFTGTLQDVHHIWLAKEQLRELNETLEQKVRERTRALQNSIDQLKAAQQQLVQAEKMAALGNLVSGVAHEVNTPLGICITMVTLHLEKLRVLDQQVKKGKMTRKLLDSYMLESQQSQSLVENNLYRAAELVQSFKKVAVEQTADRLDEIVFHDYLAEILSSIVLGLKNPQISINLVSQGDWTIKTWPGAWWQLLSNLIDNSVSHGFLNKPDGQITISAELESSCLRLIYSDNGHGMSEEACEKMYEPFYTTARSRGGTGLGMHVVFNLVAQKLGGSITCQSKPDKGVTFTIEIPT